jgi:hypothetical protein
MLSLINAQQIPYIILPPHLAKGDRQVLGWVHFFHKMPNKGPIFG